MRPELGISSRSRSLRKVVFPDPDGPTRNTNSPLSISTQKSLSATVAPLYVLVTSWNLIMKEESRGRGECTRRYAHSVQCYPGRWANWFSPSDLPGRAD